MDDAQLWELEQAGHLVAHCRAKIAADQQAIIDRRNRDALDQAARRPRLGIRWAA